MSPPVRSSHGRVLSVIVLCALAAAAMAQTPAPPAREAKTYVVGFAQDTMANDWRAAQARSLEQALAKRPGIRFVLTDGQGSTAKQIQDIEDLTAMKVDVLVTSPKDAGAMAPAVSRAYRQGIPVVLLTRTVDSEDYTSFIAPDDRAIGRQAAQYLATRLGGKGRIFVLQGVPTSSTAIRRTEGFEEELRKHRNLRIVAMKPANYLRSDAIAAVEEVLRSGLAFDAIFAQSDSMADGARLALKKAGRDPGKILIVGIDYIPAAREAIRRGEQQASFTYPTCGPEAAELILKIVKGEKVPRHITVKSDMVTRDNVDRVPTIF